MSIRFRMTLFYSLILTLTLVAFGVALYSIQSRETINSLKRDMVLSSSRLVEPTLRTAASPSDEAPVNREPPPPKPFDEFSSDQAFQELPEREIVRVLDEGGNLVASPFGRTEDQLPLSETGLAALQSQQDWWETDIVSGENMLIYSRPIVQDGQTVFIMQIARSLTERDRTLKSLAAVLGGAGSLTILIAFGAGWLLSGLSLRPIHRITTTAQAIGDERDFSRRVEYVGPLDEVGQLANTFNQMLARLQDAYRRLEHSLEMQRNFVAEVSHELRTPITTLRGNLGLLQREPPSPPAEQADILSDMVEESDRLIRLVNDLLLLATADARRSLIKKRFALQPLLEETVRQAQVLDSGRKIWLDTAQDIDIVGDRDALKQVVLILLDNAMKHSEGAIDIQVDPMGSETAIEVRDNGPGIPPEHLKHIFDRFDRGESKSLSLGFGLGLPIAKDLVEKMGGTINIGSVMGEGSIVTLRFPIASENGEQFPE